MTLHWRFHSGQFGRRAARPAGGAAADLPPLRTCKQQHRDTADEMAGNLARGQTRTSRRTRNEKVPPVKALKTLAWKLHTTNGLFPKKNGTLILI